MHKVCEDDFLVLMKFFCHNLGAKLKVQECL